MKRFSKILLGRGKIKPFLSGVAVAVGCCILITGIHSYAGVTDNTGSGLKKLMVALGIGKEDKTPADKDAFDSATLTEKVNYIASKLDGSGTSGGSGSGAGSSGDANTSSSIGSMSEMQIGYSTKEARDALVEHGFALVEERTALDGRRIYGYIKKEPVGKYSWEEANYIAENYYKQVNDWSALKGYGCIAFASNLPPYRWGKTPDNYVVENCPDYSKADSWLGTLGTSGTYYVHSRVATDGKVKTYSPLDSDACNTFPMIWTRDTGDMEVPYINLEKTYMAGSRVNVTTSEIRGKLEKLGFVQVEERVAENGKAIFAFIKKEPIGSLSWDDADGSAKEYYKQVNDWSVAQGYGCIAFASHLPSYRTHTWITNNCEGADGSGNKAAWLNTICRNGDTLFYMYTDEQGKGVNKPNSSPHSSKGCYPIIWTY